MEKLTCIQCDNIICADLDERQRVIGNLLDNTAVRFPERVQACPRRRVKVDLKSVQNLHESVGEEVV